MGNRSGGHRADYDGAWKEALDHYLEPFLHLCFPIVHAGIDWTRGAAPLDQELQEIVRDAQTSKRRVDKLFRVFRRDGTEEWLLVHLEIQSQPDRDLPARLYQYHHRIADRYHRRVVSLAVLADNSLGFRPGPYEEETWGCRVRFEYPSCKLLDLSDELLAETDNPAAVVIAAHRVAQRGTQDPAGRKTGKWELTRRLYERGYRKQDILELYRLIDWLIRLPEELAIEFRRELIKYEEQQRMPYITSIERLGRQEGLQQGLQQGRQQGRHEGWREGAVATGQRAVLDALEIRFTPVPEGLRQTIETIQDETRLRALLQAAIRAGSLDEFARAL
jgi:hypothetical protein